MLEKIFEKIFKKSNKLGNIMFSQNICSRITPTDIILTRIEAAIQNIVLDRTRLHLFDPFSRGKRCSI